MCFNDSYQLHDTRASESRSFPHPWLSDVALFNEHSRHAVATKGTRPPRLIGDTTEMRATALADCYTMRWDKPQLLYAICRTTPASSGMDPCHSCPLACRDTPAPLQTPVRVIRSNAPISSVWHCLLHPPVARARCCRCYRTSDCILVDLSKPSFDRPSNHSLGYVVDRLLRPGMYHRLRLVSLELMMRNQALGSESWPDGCHHPSVWNHSATSTSSVSQHKTSIRSTSPDRRQFRAVHNTARSSRDIQHLMSLKISTLV